MASASLSRLNKPSSGPGTASSSTIPASILTMAAAMAERMIPTTRAREWAPQLNAIIGTTAATTAISTLSLHYARPI